jgi:nitrogen fixation protein NifZ
LVRDTPSQVFEVGDLVFCRTDITNDGGVPDAEEGAVIARSGTRGIVVRAGSPHPRDRRRIYLVRFEGHDQVLGPPVACLDEELAATPSP